MRARIAIGIMICMLPHPPGPPSASGAALGGAGFGPPPAPAHAGTSAPARIGRFRVDGVLGRGAMGVVYRGWDADLARAVAIKMVLDARQLSPTNVERFLREARATARLRHPAIVGVITADVDEQGRPYLVMDFVEGESLEDRLVRGPLAPRAAAAIAEAIARGLDHAHGQGIIHRDVKPANILIDSEGARLTDFGLMRDTAGVEQSLTDAGYTVGTPHYMAPEQALGERAKQGPAADIFSLGAVLYHALAGRRPFEGASVLDVMQAVVRARPLPLRKIDPAIPAALESAVERCLAKDPRERFASAGALADELARLAPALPADLGAGARARPRVGARSDRLRPAGAARGAVAGGERSAALRIALVVTGALAVAAASAAVAHRVGSGNARSAAQDERRAADAAAVERARAAVAETRAIVRGEVAARDPQMRLEAALRALGAARHLEQVAPGDAGARRIADDAALDLADAAMALAQWSLARAALDSIDDGSPVGATARARRAEVARREAEASQRAERAEADAERGRRALAVLDARRAARAERARFVAERERMIEDMRSRHGLADEAVIGAVRAVPRHVFVDPPAAHDPEAFTWLSQEPPTGVPPAWVSAHFVALVAPKLTDRALEVGTTSGYGAALLAELTASVVTVAPNEEQAGRARELFARLGYDNVRARAGDPHLGAPTEGPFDVIVVTSFVRQIPQPLIDQLAPGGRMAIAVQGVPTNLVTKDAAGRVEVGKGLDFIVPIGPLGR